jgi:hypothetical protein
LTIIDTHRLTNQILFVRRLVGTADAKFTLWVD